MKDQDTDPQAIADTLAEIMDQAQWLMRQVEASPAHGTADLAELHRLIAAVYDLQPLLLGQVDA